MIQAREKLLADAPGTEPAELVAEAQLIHAYLAAIIADRYGNPVSYPQVVEFWKQHQSKAPKKLREMEADSADRGFFLTTFVFPDVAELALHEVYYESDAPHTKQIQTIHRLLNKMVIDPVHFEAYAQSASLPIDYLWIGDGVITSGKLLPGKGVVRLTPTEPTMEPQIVSEFSDPERTVAGTIFRYIAATPAGQVHPIPIQTPDAFQIVKVLERAPGRTRIALATLYKQSFDDWFWHEAANILVEFTDPRHGRVFLERVPWGRRLFVRKELYPEIFTSPSHTSD